MSRLSALLLALLAASPLAAQPPKKAGKPDALTPPAGFDLTMFAGPPDISYPTCLAADPAGPLFVGVDLNGSLGRKDQKGKVVRCTDTDGDGKADKFVTFTEVDSPRGLWWDGKDTLYVLHPPTITAYTDTDGDGKADKSVDVVTGLGFDLKFRGADHTTNGFRMGIDGFFYVAVGDYGAIKATGSDKRSIQLHGGGVVRVRPDGTGLEIVSRGQRNIYDVAVSPTLDLFTRDNTNDGDGWDVRLTHVVPSGKYGYPSLYKHFPDDHLKPLADYGGGSPTGALFLDEPNFPKDTGTALYTVEWGRSCVYRHPLTPDGASWKAGQEKFFDIPRPTDMDVDGLGHLYVASWKDGGFDFSKPDVGFVVRLTPTGHKPAAFPDLAKATDEKLVEFIGSPGATLRLYAQREILRRGSKPAFVAGLEKLATTDGTLGGRVAAIFTLKQLLRTNKAGRLPLALGSDDAVKEYALRALVDDPAAEDVIPNKPLADAARDKNPRVRAQAIIGIARLGRPETAKFVLSALADTDPTVSHLAVNALASLKAADLCLASLDSADGTLIPGSLKVLQQLHEPAVVDGLLSRFKSATDPARKKAILVALARLYNREADWDGKWWSTRPDTTGPYYKPVTWAESPKIAEVFKAEIAAATPESAKWLIPELVRHRVDLPEVSAATLKFAGSDPAFRPVAVALFAGRPTPPDEAIPLFAAVAASDAEPIDLRVKAVKALLKLTAKADVREALLKTLAGDKLPKQLENSWDDFARDGRHTADVPRFVKLAKEGTPAERKLAFGVLASVADRSLGAKEARAAADAAVREALAGPATAAVALAAVKKLNLDGYAPLIRGLAEGKDKAVAKLAADTLAGMKLDATLAPPGQPTIGKMKYDDVLAVVLKEKGKAAYGEKLFGRVGCANCHTVSPSEPPKGPMLAGVTVKYTRPELVESMLRPSAKIAQGFETFTFQLADGKSLTGFVVREGGTELEVRDGTGAVAVLKKADVDEKRPGKVSVMPEQLVDHLTPQELACLLAYLDTLKGK